MIEGLREGGYNGLLTVITKEGHRPIDRTKLSKSLLTDLSKLAWRSADFYRDAAVDLVSDEVTGIDFTQQCVQTASGTPHSYTKLVLATGAAPRSLPLPGLRLGDLANVFLLRTLADAQAITAALGADGRKKVVVIGSSFIGMEVANCLAGMKHDVTVVGMEATPLEHVMGARVGKIFQTLLERSGGVKFCMSAAVERASAAERADTTVGAVHLKDGTALAADVVIEGVGVAPATSYLRDNASVRLEQDGSLLTDDRFRVAALGPANDSVFAIGDIATYPYHGPGGDGRPTRIEHWNVAQNAGRSVAADIVAASAPADGARRDNTAALGTRKPFIPVFWSALGAQLRYCGSTVGRFDDVLFVGDEDKPSFVAYYTRDDTVVAVASMQKDPYMTQAAELMRHGQMPSKSAIQGGVDILAISVPSQIKI